MNMSLEDRLKVAYKKGIYDVGREILIRACIILLAGVPVADKFIGISQTQKKKLGFDLYQIKKIESKCPLGDMDISLLIAIITAFGNLPVAGHLFSIIKDLKTVRNEFAHEEHILSFNKKVLRIKLNKLKFLYSSILQELKNYCDPAVMPLLDQDILDMKVKLRDLEKTLDDHIKEKTVALNKAAKATIDAVTQIASSSTSLDNSISQAKVILDQATSNTLTQISSSTTSLDTYINQSKVKLDLVTRNVETQIASSSTSLDNTISQAKVTLDQATDNTVAQITNSTTFLNENINQAKVSLDKGNQALEDSTLKLIKVVDQVSEAVTDWNIKSNELHENKDEKILVSAKEESIGLLQNLCQMKIADGSNKGVKTFPGNIMTDVFMLRVREKCMHKNENLPSDQISYQLVLEIKTKSGELYDIVLLASEGGMGKTTFMKFLAQMFGKESSEIVGLSDYDLCMFLECRNIGIKSFDDLLKLHFSKTQKKFGLTFEEFKHFIQSKNLLILVDGFDEIHPGTKKVVAEILYMRNTRVVLSTRPGSIRNIARLIPENKNVATVQMLGILPKHHKTFVWRLLCILINDEKERKKIYFELINQLKSMVTKFGTLLNSPMILTHLVYLKVEHSEKMEKITTISEIFEAIRSMKSGQVLKRLECQLINIQDLDEAIFKFLEFYDITAFITYTHYEYELSQDTINELIEFCKKYNLPSEELLSIFFDAIAYHEGILVKTGYKYHHKSEQEFSVGKFLARCISELIMKKLSEEDAEEYPYTKLLKGNILWESLMGKISESELMNVKDKLTPFRNILKFITGELTRLSHTNKRLANVFEILAVRLVNIGWTCSYEQIFCDMQYRNEESSISSEKPSQLEKEERNEVNNVSSLAISMDMRKQVKINKSQSSDDHDIKNSSNNLYSDSDIDNTKNMTEDRDTGREDFVLTLVTESKLNKHLIMAASAKLSTQNDWVITNDMNFPALNAILKCSQPKQISIAIDSDPTVLSDFQETIALITEKKIKLELFLNGHYMDQIEGYSDPWINKNCLMVDFVGKLSKTGLNNLPDTLQSLHITLDKSDLSDLCTNLKSMTSLESLGLQISIGSVDDPKRLPKLSYMGRKLVVTLIAPVTDSCLPQIATIFAQLCPENRNGEFSSLFLRNTHITSAGIQTLLDSLHIMKLSVSEYFRIWSTEEISEYDDISQRAKIFNLGKVLIYDMLSTEEIMPKLIVIQEKSLKEMEIKVPARSHQRGIFFLVPLYKLLRGSCTQVIFKIVVNKFQFCNYFKENEDPPTHSDIDLYDFLTRINRKGSNRQKKLNKQQAETNQEKRSTQLFNLEDNKEILCTVTLNDILAADEEKCRPLENLDLSFLLNILTNLILLYPIPKKALECIHRVKGIRNDIHHAKGNFNKEDFNRNLEKLQKAFQIIYEDFAIPQHDLNIEIEECIKETSDSNPF